MKSRVNSARRRASAIIRSPSHTPPDAPNDLVAAGLWVLAVVPPAIGFWLVAGDLAGVDAQHVHQLLVGSLLTCGLGTVLAVLCGFRMPIYEGPAAAYLAALAVVSAHGHHGVAQISGGLLVAGGFVALLALLRVDRLMQRVLTPLVASLFVLIVTLAVMPATVERAIGATHGLPGNAADWISSLVVVAVTLSMRRVTRLSPYSLLAALLAGTAAHLILAGVPQATISGGLVAPILLPWGTPSITIGVAIPFMVAGALAAFNTVATGEVMAGSGVLAPGGVGAQADRPTKAASSDRAAESAGVGAVSSDRTDGSAGPALPPRAAWRALLTHGVAQAGGALLGNVVGTVSRLDSLGIVRLLRNSRRTPLLLAGGFIAVLALIKPVVDLAAAIPLSVSAALLGVILGVILAGMLQVVMRESRRTIMLVALPSLVPTAVWIAVGSSLPPDWQLVVNPLLWGVVLAVVLERLVDGPAGLDAELALEATARS